MKRAIAIFAAVMLMLSLFGCSKEGNPDGERTADSSSHSGEYTYVPFEADWAYYGSAEEIIAASDHIYIGTVTDITFEVVDLLTGQIDRNPSSSAQRMLDTIFIVEPVKIYKGQSRGQTYIRMIGGVVGYKEDEQYRLFNESGSDKVFSGIPVMNGCVLAPAQDYQSSPSKVPAVGQKYLFFTSNAGGKYSSTIINPDQFAISPNCNFAKEVIDKLSK